MPAPHTDLDDTTIVAIATVPGRGGIGIVRLSGPQAVGIVQQFVQLAPPEPRIAHYCILRDATGARIDDALITFFPAHRSYTGEDVVEIATHGSPVVLDWVVRQAVERGATPARAGQFTERAFLNNRLDLTGAEAVRDLIEAQTLAQAQQAAGQMGGSIAAAVRPVKQSLIELIAALEAGIDFAEDDIDMLPAATIVERIDHLLSPLTSLLASFAHGRVLREGLRLAIIGRPNAGKSSLFNRLVERERAIVTAAPGTTRDVIAERITVEGVPIELLDTAGLRETADEAERMGVSRSREAAAEADAILLVVDLSQPSGETISPEVFKLLEGRSVIVVENKCDLVPKVQTVIDHSNQPWARIRTSAVTGEGLPALRSMMLHPSQGNANTSGIATLTNLRQRDAVDRAVTALQQSKLAALSLLPHEMILLDLHEALHALDELTGETTTDDLLNLIFSTFCIGK